MLDGDGRDGVLVTENDTLVCRQVAVHVGICDPAS
jgi:hypothetical protein